MPISNHPHGQRMHPAAMAIGWLNIIRSTLIPILFGVFAAAGGNFFWLMAIVLFGILAPAVGVLLHYVNFRFYVDAEHLVIHEGVLSKRTRRIPFKRIHNLNSRESVVARLFKVVRLDVETAGGSAAEASLTAVTHEVAQWIRDAVRQGKYAVEEANDAPSEQAEARDIYRIRPLDIFVAGATTNRIGLIAIGVGALFQYASELNPDMTPNWINSAMGWASAQTDVSPLRLVLVLVVGVLLVFLLAWVLSIVTALVRWFGFTLRQVGDDLQIQTGLFTKREFSVPLEKIQALRCVTSAFRRPFRLLKIEVQTAGFMGAQGSDGERQQEQNLLVPITRHDRTDFFVRNVWPEANWDAVDWQGVHPYTRFRHFRGLIMIAALPTAATHVILGWFSFANPLTWVYIWAVMSLAFLVAHLTFKQMGWSQEQGFLFIRTGFLGLHFWVIPVSKIQNLAIWQDPFQRIRHLATLQVDVAGGGGREAAIPNIPVNVAWLLFNRFSNGSRLPQPKLADSEA